MAHTLRRLRPTTKMISHTGLQIFWIFFLSLTSLLIAFDYSPQYQYLHSGSLPCKTYNKTKVDCSDRDFIQVPKLDQNLATSLDLSYNFLPEITGAPFENLKVLLDLNLNHNEIAQLSVTAFTGLYSLRYLSLYHNYLIDLPNDVFAKLFNLIHLDLKANSLTAIPNKALSSLQSLKYFSFFPTGETFAEIDLSGLKNLSNLKTMHLNVMYLQINITSNTFQQPSCSPLEELTFDWYWKSNKYTIDRETFVPLANLTSLTTSFLALPALKFLQSPLYHLELRIMQIYPTIANAINITTLKVLQKFNSTLTHLVLTLNELKLFDYSFIWMPNLIILEVKWNVIRNLTKNAFYELNSLQKLILCSNQLSKVPSEALEVFRKSATLQYLDLSSNSISNIPQDAFSAVSPSLIYLNMDNNFLESFISTRWLNLFQKLNHISLTGLVVEYRYLTLPNSPLLSLQNFQISNFNLSFTSPLCSVFPNLEVVAIFDTIIVKFPSDLALHKCSHLFHLDLSGSVKNLTFLDLDNLNISISTLNTLEMVRNQVQSMKQIFIKAPMLTTLDLSYNVIKSVDADIAMAYPNLKSLNLDANGLESIAGLQGLYFLQNLSAAQNQITDIPSWLISRPSTSFTVVLDLNTNPFNCTCNIESFRKWILSDSNTWLQPGQYVCATPETLKGVSITAIELDCGSKTSLSLYLGISFAMVIMFCTLLIIIFQYRWHIKYKLFLLYRNYHPFPNNMEDDFIELNLQYHAYVAYNDESAEDTAWVMNDLQPNMEEGPEPLQLFIKSRDAIPGHSIIESIGENIQQSRKTIVVLSPNFVDSNWCHHEMEMAKMRFFNDNLNVLILVLLEDIPEQKVPLLLRQLLCKKKYLKWPKDRAGQRLFWQRLRLEIKGPIHADLCFQL